MGTYIVMTRGVESDKAVPGAAALSKVLGYIGFSRIRLSADGRDAVFESADNNKRKMEAEIAGELKYQTRTGFVAIVLSMDELAAMAAEHPLAGEGGAGDLYVTILSHEPAREDVAMLMETMNGVDRHEVAGRAVHSLYGRGYEGSRRSNEFIEKVMKVPATLRTWGQLRALSELASGQSPVASIPPGARPPQ